MGCASIRQIRKGAIPMTTMTDRKNAAISRGVGMTTQIYA
jgi:hypothetical protein